MCLVAHYRFCLSLTAQHAIKETNGETGMDEEVHAGQQRAHLKPSVLTKAGTRVVLVYHVIALTTEQITGVVHMRVIVLMC